MKLFLIASVLAVSATTLVETAQAQYRGYSPGGFRAVLPRPSPQLFYQGVRGYSQSGWEIGRMMSQRRYGTDPGPYPGMRRALGW